MHLRKFNIVLLMLLCCPSFVFLAKDDQDKKPDKKPDRKKSSPKKSKAQCTPPKQHPESTPPEHRTLEQWLALSRDEVQAACEATGLSTDGTFEALANRLVDYYQDILDEQDFTAVSSSDDFRYHSYAYNSPQDKTNTDTIRDAIKEHE